jgi:carotenoid 1,2-hydratase
VGSVFSPYYAWSGRRDPENHCAINVVLYGPRARWAMTERGRAKVSRENSAFRVGPSALSWDGGALNMHIDEWSSPLPRRIRGKIRVIPMGVNPRAFTLEEAGGHIWRPIAPRARVEAVLDAPGLSWSGAGYFDMNAGGEPLEAAFSRWTWSRAALPGGATILYEAERRRAEPLALALRFDRSGGYETFPPPPEVALPSTRWRVSRRTRSDDGSARIVRDFEDTPFYSRSLIETRLNGDALSCVHESLSLDRFAHPLVKLMLPFRMPRW